MEFTKRNSGMFKTTTKLMTIAIVVSALLVAGASAAMEPETFKPEGKGYYFYHHSMQNDVTGRDNSFDLSRMYFGGKYQVSEEFMIRYLGDIAHADGDGKFEVFTKYAYLDWTLKSLEKYKGHLILGLQGTNNWSTFDKAWGYRVIRKSSMESFGGHFSDMIKVYEGALRSWLASASLDSVASNRVSYWFANLQPGTGSKMGSSADMGVGLKFWPKENHYVSIMIRNGTGYKKIENDQYKNFQVRAGWYFLDKALHLSGYMEIEPWKGLDETGNAKRYQNLQWDFLASYEKKGAFLIGADINSKAFKSNSDDITAIGFSTFGNACIVKEKLKVLGRLDIYQTGINDFKLISGMEKPKTNATLLIVGLDYIAHKNVHLIPNVQIMSFEDDNKESEKDFFVHVLFKF